MKFKDVHALVASAYTRQDIALKACARTWKVTDTLEVEIRPTSYGPDGIATMGFWMRRPSLHYRDANRVDDLSARELRQMAAVREMVEQWQAGTIDELPSDCPIAIVQIV